MSVKEYLPVISVGGVALAAIVYASRKSVPSGRGDTYITTLAPVPTPGSEQVSVERMKRAEIALSAYDTLTGFAVAERQIKLANKVDARSLEAERERQRTLRQASSDSTNAAIQTSKAQASAAKWGSFWNAISDIGDSVLGLF